jgi:hypothetical protein
LVCKVTTSDHLSDLASLTKYYMAREGGKGRSEWRGKKEVVAGAGVATGEVWVVARTRVATDKVWVAAASGVASSGGSCYSQLGM